MSAIRNIISTLVKGGMDPIDAAALMASAMLESVPKTRSSGAERALRYREKKALRNVTKRDEVTPDENVTKRDETVTNRDNVTTLSLSIEKEPKKERKKEREVKHKPRHALQPDFKLTDAMRQLALGRGVTPEKIPKDFDRFCDYHRSKGTLSADWMASWGTWASRSVQYSQQNLAPREVSTYVDGRL